VIARGAYHGKVAIDLAVGIVVPRIEFSPQSEELLL
jgi:hypothetical protein